MAKQNEINEDSESDDDLAAITLVSDRRNDWFIISEAGDDEEEDDLEMTTLHGDDEASTLVEQSLEKIMKQQRNVQDLPKVIFLQIVALCIVCFLQGILLQVSFIDNILYHIHTYEHRLIVMTIFYLLCPITSFILAFTVDRVQNKHLLLASCVGSCLFVASKLMPVLPLLIVGSIIGSIAESMFWTCCYAQIWQLSADYALVRGLSNEKVFVALLSAVHFSCSLSPAGTTLITAAVTTTIAMPSYMFFPNSKTNCTMDFCWTEITRANGWHIISSSNASLSGGFKGLFSSFTSTDYEQLIVLGIQFSLGLACTLFVAMTIEDSVLLTTSRQRNSAEYQSTGGKQKLFQMACSPFLAMCHNKTFILLLPLAFVIGYNQSLIYQTLLHSYTICFDYEMLYVEFIVVFSGAAAITTIICSGFNLTLQVNFIIPALTTIAVQIAVFITFLIVDMSITSLIFAITSCGMAHGCLHIALLGLYQQLSAGNMTPALLTNIITWQLSGVSFAYLLIKLDVCSELIMTIYLILLFLALICYTICQIATKLISVTNKNQQPTAHLTFDKHPGWIPYIDPRTHNTISSL